MVLIKEEVYLSFILFHSTELLITCSNTGMLSNIFEIQFTIFISEVVIILTCEVGVTQLGEDGLRVDTYMTMKSGKIIKLILFGIPTD